MRVTKTPPTIPFDGIKPYTKVKISDNITQYYLKNTMLQISLDGNRETKTIVDLRNNSVIKRVVKYLCNLCQDFDCEWCTNKK